MEIHYITYLRVKKKAFKIKAKIEDVVLTEHLKSMETRNGHYIFKINHEILRSSFQYCIRLRSSNITCNSVLNWIFDTAKMLYCIKVISNQITQFFCGSESRYVQTKKRLEAQNQKAVCRIFLSFLS